MPTTFDLRMLMALAAVIFVVNCFKPFIYWAVAKFQGKPTQEDGSALVGLLPLLGGLAVAFLVPSNTLADTLLQGVTIGALASGTYAAVLKQARLSLIALETADAVPVVPVATVRAARAAATDRVRLSEPLREDTLPHQ